jgi:uncharacterized membrane protein YphA (DoxX/SURF4 family)
VTVEDEKVQLRSAAVGIAALRVWCGALLLLVAALKLGGDPDFPQKLPRWLEMAGAGGAHPQLQAFVKALAKHASTLATVTGVIEAGLGALLVVGLWTRFAAVMAMALAAFYWGITARMGVAAVGATLTMAVTAACLVIGNAGMHWGLDGWRVRRAVPVSGPSNARA